jgi:hypothetical protein
MGISDLKIYLLNGLTYLVTFILSTSDVESILKLVLLLISILYTVLKIIDIKNPNNNGKDNKRDT